MQTRVEIDGAAWFDGPATCVLVGNMGDLFGGISVFPEARADDGRLDVGVITADRAVDWVRTIGRTAIGDAGLFAVRRDDHRGRDRRAPGRRNCPYELDGEPRPETKLVRFHVQPAAITVCAPAAEDER